MSVTYWKSLVAIASVVTIVWIANPRSAHAQDAAPGTASVAEPPEAESKKEAAPESADKPSEKTAEKSRTRERTKEKPPAKKQLRVIPLSGSYEDQLVPVSLDPTSLLLGGGGGKRKGFFKLCDYIDELADEEIVSHVVFDLSDSNIGMNSAQLDELARRLSKLKAKGKKTFAWLENASNVHLSIAASCDEVLMTDFGGVDMPSSSLESMFYRDAMDLVGVKASVVRAGDFKGAVEPYTNPVMSEHLRQHYLAMLESINQAQVSRIAKGRGLTHAAVRELQKKRMLLPSEALAAGLVSKLAPYGSMKKTITDMVGNDVEWTKPKSKPKKEMSFFEFMSKAMAGPREATKIKDDSIAVLHLSGSIVDGKEDSPGEIVSGPMVKAINELTNEDHIKGVVVRINSPGGSATASEAIRQALDELAKKKPVVISMGEMAASGGYWVTCIGQPIYAEHGTITGSIGVFSLKLSMGSLFRRLGIHVESIAIDESAASDAINHAWSDNEIANMQRFIDDVYDRFLKLASASRNIPVEKLQTLAGGRVWSGDQAKQHGLIDEIGGVDDCLAVLSKKTSLTKYKVIHRPEVPSGFDLFRMLEEPDESDIGISSVSPIKQLELQLARVMLERGFKWNTTRMLFEAAIKNDMKPGIWALVPQEFRVR